MGEPRYTRDGDTYVGEVEIETPDGRLVPLRACFSRQRVIERQRAMRAQLATQAPAGVDVGRWADYGPAQQDLARWVMDEEFAQALGDQIRRRGWVTEPPWFGDWTPDTVARAYHLIESAQAGEQAAQVQLDRIRDGALKDNRACAEALAKFDAIGRMIGRGMSLNAVGAALGVQGLAELGAVPRGGTRRQMVVARPAARPVGRPTRRPPTRPTSSPRPSGVSVSSSTTPATATRPRLSAPLALRPGLVAAAPIARPYYPGYPMYPTSPTYPTYPTSPTYPYPAYPPAPYGYGGGGGGDDGGMYPLDELDGRDGLDGGEGDLFADEYRDEIPPPPDGGGWGSEDEAQQDEFPDPPPDDGSGEQPAAPAVGNEAEPGAGQMGEGARIEMVPDMGTDVYPGEGTPV